MNPGLREIQKKMPEKITVQVAAEIMGVTPRFLQMALQQNKFPFGIGVKIGKWSYYINTKRFIIYMNSAEGRSHGL